MNTDWKSYRFFSRLSLRTKAIGGNSFRSRRTYSSSVWDHRNCFSDPLPVCLASGVCIAQGLVVDSADGQCLLVSYPRARFDLRPTSVSVWIRRSPFSAHRGKTRIAWQGDRPTIRQRKREQDITCHLRLTPNILWIERLVVLTLKKLWILNLKKRSEICG